MTAHLVEPIDDQQRIQRDNLPAIVDVERFCVVLPRAVVGVALVGTHGVDEGVFGQRSGDTWLALAKDGGTRTTYIAFGGQDDYTIVRIANQALRQLWEVTT